MGSLGSLDYLRVRTRKEKRTILMAYSNSTSTKTKSDNHTENHESENLSDAQSEQDMTQLDGELNELLEQAEEWIKENQTMAMLGGFGLGVFIGVLLRR